ncbi:hypothetical protein Pmani_035329 [Petrolisthes manimaculis]|uniref:Uncharacterized protein n=1 Tax=Petrolisthes manimaculis TaxID=1843537 RepID=A0AAE1NL08_9EUCA|nr:hypothetical protein Pmani_035329 [Petrolisthes manimaculis]
MKVNVMDTNMLMRGGAPTMYYTAPEDEDKACCWLLGQRWQPPLEAGFPVIFTNTDTSPSPIGTPPILPVTIYTLHSPCGPILTSTGSHRRCKSRVSIEVLKKRARAFTHTSSPAHCLSNTGFPPE